MDGNIPTLLDTTKCILSKEAITSMRFVNTKLPPLDIVDTLKQLKVFKNLKTKRGKKRRNDEAFQSDALDNDNESVTTESEMTNHETSKCETANRYPLDQAPKPYGDSGCPNQAGSHGKPLRLLNVNCRSLCNKYAPFQNLIHTVKPDIITGTESWLDRNIKNSEFFPPEYEVYRKDRNREGGGVFVAVRKEYASVEVKELDENCELIWTQVKIPGIRTLYICSYYRPHVSDEDSLVYFSKSLYKANAMNGMLIISGDQNFPDWDWKRQALKENTKYAKLHRDFIELMNDCSLSQIIDEPTRLDNTLDLVFTNYPDSVIKHETVPGISDHEAVYVDIDLRLKKNNQIPRSIPMYNKADWEGLKSHIENVAVELHNNCHTMSVEDMWQTFKSSLEIGVQKFIPHKQCRAKNGQPWITHNIRKKIKQRDRQYKKFKKTKDPKYRERYKDLKHEIQNEIRVQYWKYVENMFEPVENEDQYNGMKRFWSFIKHRKTDNCGIAPIMKDDKLLTSAHDKATALNEQFQSVFSRKQPMSLKELAEDRLRDMEHYVNGNQPTIDEIIISDEGISKLLNNLDPRKACGPDNIQARVLKEMAEPLTPCLKVIFQKSLDTGDVPKDWRMANVAPIFKKGQRDIASNYRPVSLTCICSKILEHIVVSQIMKYSDKHGILYDLQHGFRKYLSCETQLISFVDDASKSLENGQQTDVLIMDFSKAFDKVDHGRLCHKLRKYGINGRINRWIANFLRDRSQSVVVEGKSSSSVPVVSGVPQGSVLGPTLFLLYINDLADDLSSKVRLFADDTMGYLAIKSVDDAKTLQEDLNKLAKWESINRMEFHPQKCAVLTITNKHEPIVYNYQLHGHTLAHLESAKYLGVMLQKDLKWGQHIDEITMKANRTLGFLRRNLKIGSKQIKEKAYKALVRPLVEYASCVWDPHTKSQVNQLEMVQRRAARFTVGNYHRTASVNKMLEDLQWQSLETRRKKARLEMLYKINNNMVAINNPDLVKPQRSTRNSNMHSFVKLSATRDYRKFSFYPRTVTDWNSLPKVITSASSLQSFSQLLSQMPCDHRVVGL